MSATPPAVWCPRCDGSWPGPRPAGICPQCGCQPPGGIDPDPAPAATLGRTLVPARLVVLAAPALVVRLVPGLGWRARPTGVR